MRLTSGQKATEQQETNNSCSWKNINNDLRKKIHTHTHIYPKKKQSAENFSKKKKSTYVEA